MSTVIASHTYRKYTNAGIVIVKDHNQFGVGNWQQMAAGPRYVIRKYFASEVEARAAANRAWRANHHSAI